MLKHKGLNLFIVLLSLFLISTDNANAQYGLSFYGNYKYVLDGSFHTYGGGARLEFAKAKRRGKKGAFIVRQKTKKSSGAKTAVYMGGDYNTTSKTYENWTYAYSYITSHIPYTTIVPYTEKFSLINVYFGARQYFKGHFTSNFGLYGLGEMGTLIIPLTKIYDSYDRSTYYIFDEKDNKDLNVSLTFTAGIGLESSPRGTGFFFLEPRITMCSYVDGRSFSFSINKFLSANVGVRFPIGG